MRCTMTYVLMLCLLVSACTNELSDEERYALDGKPIKIGNMLVRPVGQAKFGESTDTDVGVSQAELTAAMANFKGQPTHMGARILRNGIEYVTVEDFAVDGPTQDTELHDSKTVQDKSAFGTSRSAVQGIIGADNRYPVPDSTVWPWSTSVEVHFTDGASCSGSLIGPHTMVTAGHCFYNPATGIWRATSYFAPGADDDSPGTYPFSKFFYWSLAMPSQYQAKGDSWDFAVVDLSGGGLTGQASWLGTIVVNYFTPNTAILRSGYDADKQAPGIPNQWASNGSAYNDNNELRTSIFVLTNADVTFGGSGSGMYLNSGSNAGKLIGVLTSGYTDPFGSLNRGTHWVTWSYNFVHNFDSHWP